MIRIQDDASAATTPLPQFAGLQARWLDDRDREAELQRQVKTQAEQGDSAVLALGATFRR